ncbi:MAG TPA: 23S rRNA (adenine(2503)-C(2))-methyltransferase RlmN [Bacteroidales bacterium]|nr:23S rRNA (adenine(2503)-C(2))-methyltransferase RlmN [Bacteroidales bacterium]
MRESVNVLSLAGLGLTETEDLLAHSHIDRRYARRILYWIYKKGISTFSEINDIPKDVLSALSDSFITGLSEPVSTVVSADGTVRHLFTTGKDLLHESVFIPEGKRETVCISVQSGCRMGCRFCATGQNGWKGNLTAGEIVNQVVSLPHKVTHVVLMGMGEPGDNIDEVLKALKVLTAEWGMAIGKSRVTVSTVGITPAVKRLLEETECNITLSLYSPFPEERRKAVPAENAWPYKETLDLMKTFRAGRYRRFTVAYVMIKGKNDTDKHLEELMRLLSGTKIRVNLLPYHRLGTDSDYSSDNETMMRFKHLLVTSGVGASVRKSRGLDIEAACGMLAAGRTKQS